MKRQTPVLPIVMGALVAAIVYISTFLIRFPIPGISNGGYIHAGDGVVFAGAWLLGGPLGAAAAAIGAFLADITAGAVAYAFGSIVCKGLIAFLYARLIGEQASVLRIGLCAGICGLVMMAVYFLYDTLLFGVMVAVASVGMNGIQAVGGIILAIVLQTALSHMPSVVALRNRLRMK